MKKFGFVLQHQSTKKFIVAGHNTYMDEPYVDYMNLLLCATIWITKIEAQAYFDKLKNREDAKYINGALGIEPQELRIIPIKIETLEEKN